MSASRIQPAVRRMLDAPGYYVCGDRLAPRSFEVPLLSKDGKVYCVHVKNYEVDRELDPTGFSDTITIRGPMSREDWMK